MLRQLADAKHLHTSFCHRVVVLDRAAANADGANQNTILVDDGQAAGEGDQPVIGMFDAVKRAAWLGQLAKLTSGHAEETGRLRLFDGNVDGADPGVVHAQECLEIGAGVDHGDAHLRLERDGLVACGLDGLLGAFQIDVHGDPFKCGVKSRWCKRARRPKARKESNTHYRLSNSSSISCLLSTFSISRPRCRSLRRGCLSLGTY